MIKLSIDRKDSIITDLVPFSQVEDYLEFQKSEHWHRDLENILVKKVPSAGAWTRGGDEGSEWEGKAILCAPIYQCLLLEPGEEANPLYGGTWYFLKNA